MCEKIKVQEMRCMPLRRCEGCIFHVKAAESRTARLYYSYCTNPQIVGEAGHASLNKKDWMLIDPKEMHNPFPSFCPLPKWEEHELLEVPVKAATEEDSANWSTHNWSGWPGAFCLKCMIEDPAEIALGMDQPTYTCPKCPDPTPSPYQKRNIQ